jgi:1,4-alpha-glucan branching enzyme
MRGAPTAEDAWVDAVARGASDDPFAYLGPHETVLDGRRAVSVRTMQPSAEHVELRLPADRGVPMMRRHPDGLFETTVPLEGAIHTFDYRLRIAEGGHTRDVDDPYRYGQVLSDFDLHLFSEGNGACTSRSGRQTPSA